MIDLSTAYWSQSQVLHTQPPPVMTVQDPVLIDDEAQRLINDADLLIQRDRLLLLEIIGQGESLLSCQPLLTPAASPSPHSDFLNPPSSLFFHLTFILPAGHFGCVYRGFLKMNNTKEEVEVAVKTLKTLTGLYHITALYSHL